MCLNNLSCVLPLSIKAKKHIYSVIVQVTIKIILLLLKEQHDPCMELLSDRYQHFKTWSKDCTIIATFYLTSCTSFLSSAKPISGHKTKPF